MTNRVSNSISDETLSRIIQIESNGDPEARARTSTATGLGQFLTTTWMATVREHRPDLLEGRTQAQVLALRTDSVISIEMLARHTEDNARILGPGYTDGDIYLAHFSGVGVARKLMRAPTTDPVSKYYSQRAIAANRSILEGKTVGQVRGWAARKMTAADSDWISEFWPPEKNVDGDAGIERVETAPGSGRSALVEAVQNRLDAMGYPVGTVDGRMGTLTAGAIGSFRRDRGVGGESIINDALLDELDTAEAEGFYRPIAARRSTATPDEVARSSEAVKASRQGKIAARWATFVGIITTALTAISEFFRDAWDLIAPLRQFFGYVPLWVWIGVGTAVVIFLWQRLGKAESDGVTAYREGRLL